MKNILFVRNILQGNNKWENLNLPKPQLKGFT
jgi:hypothetical protein